MKKYYNWSTSKTPPTSFNEPVTKTRNAVFFLEELQNSTCLMVSLIELNTSTLQKFMEFFIS